MRVRTMTLFVLAYAIELACLVFALLFLAPVMRPGLPDDGVLRLAGAVAGLVCFLLALRVATNHALHLWLGSSDWRERLGAKLLGTRHRLARRIAFLALIGDAIVLGLTTRDFQTLYWPSLAGLGILGLIYWVGAAVILKRRGQRLMGKDGLPV